MSSVLRALRNPCCAVRCPVVSRLSCPRAARRKNTCVHAASGDVKAVYKGVYGDWSVEEEDVLEVNSYRAGLNVAAAAVLAGSAAALLPDSGVRDALQGALDPICFTGAAGFGVSLFLIHIYVTPLKQALQVFWALGTAGMAYLALTQDVPVAEFVVQHREAVWLVGPLFAALTGVAFKEGLCYGKAEAAVLFFLTPALLGGHLLGFLPDVVEQGLLAAMATTLAVFAGRKWTQPLKDDIGDKSVFMHQAAVRRGEVVEE